MFNEQKKGQTIKWFICIALTTPSVVQTRQILPFTGAGAPGVQLQIRPQFQNVEENFKVLPVNFICNDVHAAFFVQDRAKAMMKRGFEFKLLQVDSNVPQPVKEDNNGELLWLFLTRLQNLIYKEGTSLLLIPIGIRPTLSQN